MILSKKLRGKALVLAILLAATSMSACSAKKQETDDTHTVGEKASYTLSLGIVLSTDGSAKGSAADTLTAAAVILDKDDRIVECYIDCAQNKMNITDGIVETGAEYKTKNEKGDGYGLADASPIGEEWDDQAEFFADHVEGMNADEVSAIALSDGGSAADADLSAGCTIDISDMKKALLKAMNDKKGAAALTSDKAPDLRVSLTTYDTSSKSATESSSGTAAMYTDICALAVTNGRIDGAVIDSAEPKITFNKSGEIGDIVYDGTKLEQGKDYGMLIASTIGKEWYEQAAFFCEHIKGMSADEVSSIATKSDGKPGDADLSAGCTIAVDKYIKAVTKALRQ